MNSLEIFYHLSQLPNHTIRVYPSDMIPKTWEKPAALVFNTDNSKKPGTHWVAVYVDKNSQAWYFDSYGIPPLIPEHVRSLRNNCKTIRHNDQQMQSPASTVCGQFCIMFLYCMTMCEKFEDFRDLFSKDLTRNDAIALDFVKSLNTQKKSKNKHASLLIGNGQQRTIFSQTCRAKMLF